MLDSQERVEAGGGPAAGDSGPEPDAHEVDTGAAADDREALRRLVLKAHPDAVPELITGSTLGEMLASLPAAQAAWRRVAEQAAAQAPQPETQAPAYVPSGAAVRSAMIDPDSLSPLAKIRRGIA